MAEEAMMRALPLIGGPHDGATATPQELPPKSIRKRLCTSTLIRFGKHFYKLDAAGKRWVYVGVGAASQKPEA